LYLVGHELEHRDGAELVDVQEGRGACMAEIGANIVDAGVQGLPVI